MLVDVAALPAGIVMVLNDASIASKGRLQKRLYATLLVGSAWSRSRRELFAHFDAPPEPIRPPTEPAANVPAVSLDEVAPTQAA